MRIIFYLAKGLHKQLKLKYRPKITFFQLGFSTMPGKPCVPSKAGGLGMERRD